MKAQNRKEKTMELNCVISNSATALLKKQINLIGEKLKLGRKQIIIVPDKFSVTMERLVLEQLGLEASFNLEVVSFMRLVHLCAPTGYEHELLSPLGSAMIVQMLMKKHADKLKLFRGKVQTGVAVEVARTIASFKSSKLAPEQVNAMASGKVGGLNQNKMHDLALVYSAYEQYVTERYTDVNSRMDVLEDSINISGFFSATDIHMCCFSDLTSQGFNVLRALLTRADTVSVGALRPIAQQKNKGAYSQDFYYKLKAISETEGVKYNETVADSLLMDERKFVLENLFGYPTLPYTGGSANGYELYTAAYPRAEVELLARFIKQHIVLGGRFNDFSIVCTSLDSYTYVVQDVFEQLGIPAFIDTNVKVTDTEVFRLVTSAFDIINKNYMHTDFFAYAKNGILDEEQEQVNRLEIIAIKFALEGSRLSGNISKALPTSVQLDENLALLHTRLISPLKAFGKNIKAAKTVGDYCKSIAQLLESVKAEQRLEAMSKMFLAEHKLKEESVTRQTFAKLSNLLNELSCILDAEEVSVNEFVSLLKMAADETSIAPIPMSIDSVFVGQANSSLFIENKVVWVLGAVSDSFPGYVQDAGLLSDREFLIINKQFSLAPSIKETNRLAKQEALQLLTLGTERLCMSYPQSANGAGSEPSIAMLHFASCFGIKVVSAEGLYSLSALDVGQRYRAFALADSAGALNRLAHELRAKADGIGTMSADAGSVAEMVKQSNLANVFEIVLKNVFGDSVSHTNIKDAANVFLKDGAVRVTEIERYFECPYRHFVQYGLKLTEQKTSRVQAMDVGNILHRVAELFLSLNKGKVFEDEQIVACATDVFNRAISEPEFERFRLDPKNEFVLGELRREAIRLCGAINYQNANSQFKPVLIEASFGQDKNLGEFTLAVFNKKLVVRGKLDRADVYKGKYRLIDYKTSRASSKFSLLDLYLGKKLQLFIYLFALTRTPDASPAGAYYLPVVNDFESERDGGKYARFKMQGVTNGSLELLMAQDGQVGFEHPKSDIIPFAISTAKDNVLAGEIKVNKSDWHLTLNQLNACLGYAKSVFAGALGEIMDGYIEAKPLAKECDWCVYKSICRLELKEGGNAERDKDFDVVVESFSEIMNES